MAITGVTDADLWVLLNTSLSKYPNLHSLMPVGWPSNPTYNISLQRLSEYMENREGEYVINLPLILFNLEVNPHKPFTDLFSSIMNKFESFCVDFIASGVPNADKIIDPIWTDNWNLHDSRFFAVVAEIYFSYFLKQKGHQIKEFEKPYNPLMGSKNADILFAHQGRDVYLDIKSPKSLDRIWFNKQLRTRIEKTALNNMNKEFQHLDPKNFGVIAHIYRPLRSTSRWFKYKNMALDIVKHPTDVNKFSHIYWIKPVFTVTGRDLVVFDKDFDFSPYLMKPWWKRKFLITKYYLLNQLELFKRFILLLRMRK